MKSNGNMYEGWETFNPLAGPCEHNCSYCSRISWMNRFEAHRQKYTGVLRLNPKAMNKNLGNGKKYFVVSQGDLFAKNVLNQDILQILEYCGYFDNTYLFQTKNPERFQDFIRHFPQKSILCTTIETNRYYPQMGNTPLPVLRADAMSQIKGFKKFVTCEPLFDFDLDEFVELLKWTGAVQINVGADSKKHHLPEPSKEKVWALIAELEKFTLVLNKTNLNRLL
jgi:protein gp37